MDDDKKDIYKQKVQDIVESAPFIQSRAWVYGFLALTVIVLLITINIQNPNYWILTGFVVFTVILGLNTYLFAPGYGKTKWIDFENDLQSQINAGVLPNKILENYKQEEQAEKMREAMSQQRQNNGPRFNLYPYQ